MPIRGLTIGAVLVAVLAGLVYWSQRTEASKQGKESEGAAPKLISIKSEEVSKLELRRAATPPAIVVKNATGGWELTSPQTVRVDAESVNGVLTAWTGLTWSQLVDEKASELAAYGLTTPAAEILVTSKQGAKRLLIGDEVPTGTGFYAKLDGDNRVFIIDSATKASLDKTWKDLRDKRLLTFDSEQLSRVTLSAKGQVLEFGKSAGSGWQILKPQPMRADSLQVEELVRKIKGAQLDITVPDEEATKAASAFSSGTRVGIATATDPSGTQQIEVRKSGETYYARSSVIDGTHKVANDVGEGLNKGLEDFRNKKLFDFGFEEPSKVTIRDGEKTYSFVKGGADWWANGKRMDATSVQALIDKLRDLSAIKFVSSGSNAPLTEVTVTSNEGKRTEKVIISQTGNSHFAKRENEPAIYELDPKAVEELRRAAADVKEPPKAAPTPASK